jgi:hypothetical protein
VRRRGCAENRSPAVLALHSINLVVQWAAVREARDSLLLEGVDAGRGRVRRGGLVVGV